MIGTRNSSRRLSVRRPSSRKARDASGLPNAQLAVRLGPGAEDVAVADARVQRILTNLLENAHRHGDGATVRLAVRDAEGPIAEPVELLAYLPGQHAEVARVDADRAEIGTRGLDGVRDAWAKWSGVPLTADELQRARMILWKGHCSVHGRFTLDSVREVRERVPGVNVLVHPECGCAGQLVYAMGVGDIIPDWSGSFGGTPRAKEGARLNIA